MLHVIDDIRRFVDVSLQPTEGPLEGPILWVQHIFVLFSSLGPSHSESEDQILVVNLWHAHKRIIIIKT